ncbi:MAG: MotA/TolQ/ExbB proton channel family protein [Bacteroidetes bacterium]|nr:MotA/TolQ/ExbB proton channel family protein [Bacteroidota bacterium]MCB0845169.1 MotA/TolQ/ExbB proton channel family protein [Bacteroidota bacterium]
MLFLLQTPADSLATASETVATKSFFQILLAGGWTMIPLLILLVLAIFIYIERYLTISKADFDSKDLMKNVRKHVLAGNIEAAKGLCESTDNAFSRMIHKGISRLGSASLKDIEGSIENIGKLEVFRLERRLSILATVAGAAPMIGFFGTVLGMISAFNAIVIKEGNANPVDLAGGISEAMVTTASGLVVGILAFLAYNTLVAMVNKVVFKLELTSTDFIDLLQEPAS